MIKTSSRIQEQVGTHDFVSRERYNQYKKQSGARESRCGHLCAARLTGQQCTWRNNSGCDCLPPGCDHASFWVKDGRPYSFVFQPYEIDDFELGELVRYCERYGLRLLMDAGLSWHYPGETILIELRKEDTLTNRQPTEAVIVTMSDVKAREVNQDLGGWVFNPKLLTVTWRHYEIDLERLTTSAQLCDIIFQVAQKTWATDEVLAGLVRVFQFTLRPQALLCGSGVELGPVNIKKSIRRRPD